jgi:hypothetical protein
MTTDTLRQIKLQVTLRDCIRLQGLRLVRRVSTSHLVMEILDEYFRRHGLPTSGLVPDLACTNEAPLGT